MSQAGARPVRRGRPGLGTRTARHARPTRKQLRSRRVAADELLLRAQAEQQPGAGGRDAAAAAERRKAPPASILLTVTTVTLVAIGLVMILSASSVEAYKRYGSSFLFFNRQVIGAVVGLGGMFVLARSDYRRLRRLTRPMLFGVLLLLAAVLVPGLGVSAGGAARWLPLGPFSLQPSELAKLAVVFFCADTLERKGARIADPKELATTAPMVGAVLLLVMLQPDLGTAMVCGGCALVVVFLAGTRLRHMSAVVTGAFVGVSLLIATEGYRRARLFSFLDPWADPLNTGYQTIQGQIALGSGGLFGVGLGASRQKWSYVPHAHTDFIYAIIGEELGLLGTLAVLALFVFFVYLGIRTARRAPDRFGMLLAGGITGWIGLQALINMGAVTGMLPITGVPLPLISFGGSALVFTLAGIGILLSVARRGQA